MFPQPHDYPAYFGRYISLIDPAADLLTLLPRQLEETQQTFGRLPAADLTRPYGPGKWTALEILVHLLDCERVFAYRLLAIARGEQTTLPSFDQDEYVRTSGANGRELPALLTEYAAQRGATVALLQGLSADSLSRRGATSAGPVTAQALAWIVAGHERHHLNLLPQQYPALANEKV